MTQVKPGNPLDAINLSDNQLQIFGLYIRVDIKVHKIKPTQAQACAERERERKREIPLILH